MTETNMNTSNPTTATGSPARSVPAARRVGRVVDPDTAARVPRARSACIEVAGPERFKGYWRMPEKTG
jgi:hypothetical protein